MARRTNQQPPFCHLASLSAHGYGREPDHVAMDRCMTGSKVCVASIALSASGWAECSQAFERFRKGWRLFPQGGPVRPSRPADYPYAPKISFLLWRTLESRSPRCLSGLICSGGVGGGRSLCRSPKASSLESVPTVSRDPCALLARLGAEIENCWQRTPMSGERGPGSLPVPSRRGKLESIDRRRQRLSSAYLLHCGPWCLFFVLPDFAWKWPFFIFRNQNELLLAWHRIKLVY